MLINHPLFVSQWHKSVQVMIVLLITWYHGLWICIQFVISDFCRGDWKACLQGKWTIFINVNIGSVIVCYNADICTRIYQCSVNDNLSMFRLDYLRYKKYFDFCNLSCCWQFSWYFGAKFMFNRRPGITVASQFFAIFSVSCISF